MKPKEGQTEEMNALLPSETDLIGQWIKDGDRIVADAVEERIKWLVANALVKVATGKFGGWTILYRDPADDRMWELTYPHSDWHGGGPKRLTVIARQEVLSRYPGANL